MKMLQVNFIMIYIIDKILVPLKTIRILKGFLKSLIEFKKKVIINCFHSI